MQRQPAPPPRRSRGELWLREAVFLAASSLWLRLAWLLAHPPYHSQASGALQAGVLFGAGVLLAVVCMPLWRASELVLAGGRRVWAAAVLLASFAALVVLVQLQPADTASLAFIALCAFVTALGVQLSTDAQGIPEGADGQLGVAVSSRVDRAAGFVLGALLAAFCWWATSLLSNGHYDAPTGARAAAALATFRAVAWMYLRGRGDGSLTRIRGNPLRWRFSSAVGLLILLAVLGAGVLAAWALLSSQ